VKVHLISFSAGKMVNYTVIPAVTRDQLVENSFVFAHADALPYDGPVKSIAYLKENVK
jgi:hypothetical protein